MTVLLIIFAAAVITAAACVVRAILSKGGEVVSEYTPDSDERAIPYGEKLGRMVSCKTVSGRYDTDKTKFYNFHKILENEFPNIHKVCEKHVFDGSLLFKWSGSGCGDPILLMSHHDVVEAGGKWEHPPFCGEIIDGNVWGRGTVDTKGSLFCIMQAVEELIAGGFVPNCDVYIASSCTEEFSGDGAPLTAKYLEENGIKLRLVLDEGGMIIKEPIKGIGGVYAMVGVLEKGYGDLKFVAKGNGGHASAPEKRSPITRLAEFVSYVEKRDPFKAEFHPTVKEMFSRMLPGMNFKMRLVFSNMWLFSGIVKKLMPSISSAGAAMMKTTVAFTMAKGSDGLNVIPQTAYVTGNLRFIHHQSTDESIKLISDIAKKFGVDTEIIYKDYPCPVVNFNSEEFRTVEETVNELFKDVTICPYPMTGGTDSKYYYRVCENILRFAPLYITAQQHESIHGLNENIAAAVLPKAVDFYKKLIIKF